MSALPWLFTLCKSSRCFSSYFLHCNKS